MQDNNKAIEQRLTLSTINGMVRVLNDALRKDPSLANDLFLFLKERNIEVPTLTQKELSELIPVSYKKKNSTDQIHRLKGAFEDVNSIENIL